MEVTIDLKYKLSALGGGKNIQIHQCNRVLTGRLGIGFR